jgi:hypothetical protein
VELAWNVRGLCVDYQCFIRDTSVKTFYSQPQIFHIYGHRIVKFLIFLCVILTVSMRSHCVTGP